MFCSRVSYADVLFFVSLKEREEVSEEVDGWNMLKPDTQNSSDDFLSVSTPFFCDFLCLCGRLKTHNFMHLIKNKIRNGLHMCSCCPFSRPYRCLSTAKAVGNLKQRHDESAARTF